MGTHLLNFFENIARPVPRDLAPLRRQPRKAPRDSRPPAPPPRAYPQPCRGPKTSWIALFCPLNTGGYAGANDQRDAGAGWGAAIKHELEPGCLRAGCLLVSIDT